MEQISKIKFKEIYFKYGKADDGWNLDYWNKFYENPKQGMKFLAKLPENEEATRMMIVDDYSSREYRLFFVSENQEDEFFR